MLPRSRFGVEIVSAQCDQMLELKVAHILHRLPKNIHSKVYLKRDIFVNAPKPIKHLGYFYKKI